MPAGPGVAELVHKVAEEPEGDSTDLNEGEAGQEGEPAGAEPEAADEPVPALEPVPAWVPQAEPVPVEPAAAEEPQPVPVEEPQIVPVEPAVAEAPQAEPVEPAAAEEPQAGEAEQGKTALESIDLSQFEVLPSAPPQGFVPPAMSTEPEGGVPAVSDEPAGVDEPAASDVPPVPSIDQLSEVILPTTPTPQAEAPAVEGEPEKQEADEAGKQPDEVPLTEMTLDEILLDLPYPDESAGGEAPAQPAGSAAGQPSSNPPVALPDVFASKVEQPQPQLQFEPQPQSQQQPQSQPQQQQQPQQPQQQPQPQAQPQEQPKGQGGGSSINGLPPDIMEHIINKAQIFASQGDEDEPVPGFFDEQDKKIEIPPEKTGFFSRRRK